MASVTYIDNLLDWSESISWVKLKLPELEHMLALSDYQAAFALILQLQTVFNNILLSTVQLSEKEKAREISRNLRSDASKFETLVNSI